MRTAQRWLARYRAAGLAGLARAARSDRGHDLTDFTDARAVAAISRITHGNFRLIHRLFAQIDRVLRINGLSAITNDVIEAARSTLVIGDT